MDSWHPGPFDLTRGKPFSPFSLRPPAPSVGSGAAGRGPALDTARRTVRVAVHGDETLTATCNLCGGTEFEDFKVRVKERCRTCGSLGRHRLCVHFAQEHGFLSEPNTRRMLHIAPEKMTSPVFRARIGMGYTGADALPSGYPHVDCLRLFLPDGMDIFPDHYFDLIVHNHVLEHVPGNYQDALNALLRCVAVGGMMIFSVPGPWFSLTTEEGGEHLASDAERVARFGQANHLKRFGGDMPRWLGSRPDGKRLDDALPDEVMERLSLSRRCPIMIWKRTARATRTDDVVPEAVVPGVLRGEVRNRHRNQ